MSKRLYQRNIPLYITCFIIGILTVHYFVSWGPLDVARGAVLQWGNIVSLLIWIFVNIVLIINHTRRVVRGRERALTHRDWYESLVILVSFVIFMAFGFTNLELLDRSGLFQTYYVVLVGAIYLGSEALGITHSTYNVWRRIVTSSLTPEMLAFLFVFFFKTMRDMSLVVWLWPQVFSIGDWIILIPYTTSYRAITIIGAIGTLVVAVRTLVGKEPGIIEAEIG